MASGCPAVRAVRTVRRSGDAFGIGRELGAHGAGAKQGDNDRIRACSRTFRTSRTPPNCRSRGGTTSGEVGRQILATKWDRPRSRRRHGQCDLQTILYRAPFAISKLRVHDIIVLTTANGFR